MKNVNTLMTSAQDVATYLHEGWHSRMEQLRQNAMNNTSEQDVRDWQFMADWLGLTSPFQQLTTEHHERLADGGLVYLFEGKAPISEMQLAFARFNWRILLMSGTRRGMSWKLASYACS